MPFKDTQEGQTHTACKSRLKKEGGNAKCCFCERHFPCNFFPILEANEK